MRKTRVLLLVTIIKSICELALLAFAGRWLLGLLSGAKKDANFFYQILDILTKPFVSAARFVSPKVVLDRHVPLVAVSVLVILWLVAVMEKINICTQIGMELCR